VDVHTLPVAGRYEVVRPLGHGAFGRTFLARDREREGREVALKLFDVRGAPDLKALELFEREADVLRALRHHGIPEVHGRVRDTWEGAPAEFLVMEYVAGASLAETIAAGRPLDPVEVVGLLVELLGVLDYLHGRVPPILHRDIKPANIVVRPDGRPVLVDFGSVRRVFRAPDESGSTVAGTYGYMPYEQYMGQASPASDLYALGATFLHLVTGRPPREFMGEEGRIRVPATLPGDPRLASLLARLLRPSPAERFASAREALHALLAPPSTALVALPAGAAPDAAEGRRVARFTAAAVALPPTPRPLDGAMRALLDRAAPSLWAYMDSSGKPGDRVGAMDVALRGFYSLISFGLVPAILYAAARGRRRRVGRFLRDGESAMAEVLAVLHETSAAGETLVRVTYEFEADGARRRDTDRLLPVIAGRWQPGDHVQVLYLASEGYDSVILSAG
jgi:hypothetical protein